ncbi:CynX/NimT family MFS transporter [Brevundimonas sp. SORGH_AS_0993]|uniref:MFS transporter n=1 Tax=Brevundimonas sp. SORGH_AS_0993 TaxID=3041794 RepID=UPI00278112DF|nr:MFS transporter [Brevundimonas sp. SORGH_AS_0993]MDQ1153649.1 MFS family permease [Brevundimonas sp. SORGH_AS_0993]
MPRKYLVMFAASLGFFFITATTFTSLGYVLYTMVGELHWSQAAAGLSFACLGLACGLSSPLPPLLMKWFGSRWTMFLGGMVLAAGFGLASIIQHIYLFFLATSLMGIGFSLIAPAPAVYLLATWFPKTAARWVGFYFMAGAFGGVVGPLIVGAVVGLTGSWRLHWMVMAGAAAVVGLVCLICVRDAVKVETTDQVKAAGSGGIEVESPIDWTVSAALRSRAFLFLALAMIVVQTVVTTMHSVLVTHVASLGGGSAPGAIAMSLLALTGTLAKGVTGALSEKTNPKGLLVGGLLLQSAAIFLLSLSHSPVLAYVFALIFGVGWGLSWLSAHILLLRYFGSAIAGEMVAMATMATTFAVLGPILAGWVADETGAFVPVFFFFAGLLAVVALSTALFMHKPTLSHRADRSTPAPTKPGHAASIINAAE